MNINNSRNTNFDGRRPCHKGDEMDISGNEDMNTLQ